MPEAIGVYCLTNTGSVLVHQIDYANDRVLASVNGVDPEWCAITEEYYESTGEIELGFYLGSFYVPFIEVMRI